MQILLWKVWKELLSRRARREAGRGGGPGQQTFTCHAVKIQTAQRRKWMEGQRKAVGGRQPGPGPDNGELSGLRRGVGDISQIRTDHKPLDAIQFCGAAIRRLIMCHPSIRPPPAAVSPAINPLMTSCALRQSPLSLLPPSSRGFAEERVRVKKGIKEVGKRLQGLGLRVIEI